MKTTKTNYWCYLKLITIVTILLCAPWRTIFGAEEDLTYTISVEAVENQINKNATYYDLLVTPSQKQNLIVVVSNTGNETKKIRVAPTNAITNQNGVIDYSRQKKDYSYDTNLKMPFTSLVGSEQIVEVEPGERKPVVFELAVPNEPFEGMILGGFLADLPDEKTDEETATGVKIVNKFQLVKAVMLRENEDAVAPDLILNDVKPNLVSYRTAVTANLQNTQPTMFGQLKVESEITEKGKKEVIKKQTVEAMEMAPYSNFDFPIMWENQRLEAGDYTLNLRATSGGKEWQFTEDFSITAKESEALNKEAVELPDLGPNYWLYLLIAVIVLVILTAVVVIVIYHKKKKEVRKRKRGRSNGKTTLNKNNTSPEKKRKRNN